MTGLSVTIGVWHEAGRDERRCPGYYAADWEVLRTAPGDYPLRLTFEGGYTMPMPYWLLARIDATRIDGREYSGFGGNNFASNALAVGEKPLHVQMYAYQLAELVAAGRVTVFPEFVGLVDRDAQLEWARGKSWADLQALATVGGQLAMTRTEFSGKVRVYAVNQDTGEETAQGHEWLSVMFEDDREAFEDAREALQTTGRYYVGGGAAQLFLLFAIPR